MRTAHLLVIVASIYSTSAVAQLTGLVISGNPESANGATWSYQQTINGTVYDLTGILLKPAGTGSFPAVIINHGTGGNVNGYSRSVSQQMVQWNYVCIAVNLCHSSGVPIGSPGDASPVNFGASTNNYLRAMKCWDILASLNYVDTNCVMAFGHSRGAYLTTGLVATYPDKFSAAGHTAGGVTTQPGFSAPTTTLAGQITCPYIIHHGDADNTVPIAMDSLLNSVFDSSGIPHQFHRYVGYTHSSMSQDSLMYERTRQWFLTHGCSTSNAQDQFTGHGGVYFLGSANVPISTSSFSNPNIGGVVVRFRWNDLESSPGSFNWSFIDGEIAKAVTYGKKASLQPLGVPGWLAGLGAEQYYAIQENPFSPEYGQLISGTIPWDSVYVSRVKLLIQNLAVRYANNPVVTYVSAVGVNFSQNLPDTVVTDTVNLTKQAFWTAYDYNADSLGALMNEMTDYYMSVFPSTPLWCSVDPVIFQPNATGQPRNYLASIYCGHGIANYPDRFGLFREDLSGCNPFVQDINTSSHWYLMQQNPCRTGAQMLWSVQDGPSRMNQCGISPNTKTMVLDSAVNKGLALGMRYLEIYGSDIVDASLTSTIQQANVDLLATAAACASATNTVALRPRVFLEGPYNSSTLQMSTALRSGGLVPLAEPYTAAGYAHTGGGGGEATTSAVLAVTGANAVVDWVVVELRSAGSPSNVVSTRSALLQADGDVVAANDGTSPVTFSVPNGSYHVAIRHRNHLGIMTASALALTTTAGAVDLSNGAVPLFGGANATKAIGTRNVMLAGDVDGSGTLKYTGPGNDRDPILVRIGGTIPTNTVTGYYREDVNLSGVVKYTGGGNDRDPILVNIGGTVPTNTRAAQLP